jgi:hypothetical protein
MRFSAALQTLTEASQDTYAVDTNDVPLLNEGLKSTAKHLDQSRALLDDEAKGWEEGVLEDLKRQRDALVSMRDLFDRRDKYAKDNIPYLEKRIATNEQKLQGIRNKPAESVKPGEAEKVEDAIFKVSLPFLSSLSSVSSTTRGGLGAGIGKWTMLMCHAGQRIHRTATRSRRLHQGVYSRRAPVFPADAVSDQ